MCRPRLPVPSFLYPKPSSISHRSLQPMIGNWPQKKLPPTTKTSWSHRRKQLVCWFQLILWPPPYLRLWLASSSTTIQSKGRASCCQVQRHSGQSSISTSTSHKGRARCCQAQRHSGQSGHSLTHFLLQPLRSHRKGIVTIIVATPDNLHRWQPDNVNATVVT